MMKWNSASLRDKVIIHLPIIRAKRILGIDLVPAIPLKNKRSHSLAPVAFDIQDGVSSWVCLRPGKGLFQGSRTYQAF